MPSYGAFAPQRDIRGTADVDELPGLLQQWSTLKNLTLSGYSIHPRLFSASLLHQPLQAMPTYRLTELSLVATDLSGATLLWLLGDSLSSLRTLNLSTCSGLTADTLAHVFAFLGPTLENLYLALDLDDLDPASASAPLDSAILAPLEALTSFTLSSDTLFPETLLLQLVALPSLQRAVMCCPSFSHDIVKRAVAALPAPGGAGGGGPASGRRKAFEQLTLDAWELHDLWSEADRWEVLQACEAKGVEVFVNGVGREEIEDGAFLLSLAPFHAVLTWGCMRKEWYGEDMTAAWEALEESAELPSPPPPSRALGGGREGPVRPAVPQVDYWI